MVKEPGYSLVAVLGLAVGLAAFLLLSGFARYSWSYDAHVPDAGQVYVIKLAFQRRRREAVARQGADDAARSGAEDTGGHAIDRLPRLVSAERPGRWAGASAQEPHARFPTSKS